MYVCIGNIYCDLLLIIYALVCEVMTGRITHRRVWKQVLGWEEYMRVFFFFCLL